MAPFYNLDAFLCRYTSLELVIRANSEEVRLIQYMEMTFVDELPFVLPWWYITCTIKLTMFAYRGSDFETLKSMLSCSESLMGSYCEFSNCILDK
jgi:hypothetical protein